jgi:hypothetical protein
MRTREALQVKENGVTLGRPRSTADDVVARHMNLLVTVLGGLQPAESEQDRAAADQQRWPRADLSV